MTSKRKIWLISSVSFLLIIALGIAGYLINFLNMLKNEDSTYWEKEVSSIEARYKDGKPQGVVVFIGSSSIVKWKTLEKDMALIKVVNHGFGGSKIADATYYANRLIFPFKPAAVVIYSGTNDINGVRGSTRTGEEVFKRTVSFFETVHKEMPLVPIYFISITPNNAYWSVWKDARKANELTGEYCKTNKNLTFIDMSASFLGPDGKPNKSLFEFDGLHMNSKGYKIWTDTIHPLLLKDLDIK